LLLPAPQWSTRQDGEVAATVLFVEDDVAIRRPTAELLRGDGYDVLEVGSGEEALERLAAHPIACVLVDLMLPGMDGFDLTRAIRQRSGVPVIVVTAKDDPFDVVAGLEAGADDYVTKPFEPKVLVARIRAALRRVQPGPTPDEVIRLGGRVEVQPEAGVVVVDGDEISLTSTEFRLLCELAANAGRVLSRDQLLESVWGYDYFGETKLIDVHMHRLRAKIEADPAEPVHVVTVRGLGYKAVP
jgi:DNA-binding response OmpR family regulator